MQRPCRGFLAACWKTSLILVLVTIGIFIGCCAPIYARNLHHGDSIAEAIAAAIPGEVITLFPGIYEGAMFINKSVALRGVGADPGAVIIRDTTSSLYPLVQIESYPEIDVEFANLTLRQPHGPAIQVEGNTRLLLDNVVISGCGLDGFMARGEAQVTIVNSTITGNGGVGVQAWDSPQITLTDSTVSDNGGCGIHLWDNAQLALEGATVTGNGEHGLLVTCNAHVTMKDSLIADNTLDGMRLNHQGKVEILNSHFLRNKAFGIRIPQPGCVEEPDPYQSVIGEVIGSGNLIPGPEEPEGNREGDVCPDWLKSLEEPAKEETE